MHAFLQEALKVVIMVFNRLEKAAKICPLPGNKPFLLHVHMKVMMLACQFAYDVKCMKSIATFEASHGLGQRVLFI